VKNLNKIQVLIVDDDPTVAELHRKFVSILDGFEVIAVAKTGKEALSFIEILNIDLILLDIFMPEIDGFGILHKVREINDDIDVIMVTAGQEGELINEAVRLGVFDYLLKPFDFNRFKSTMFSFQHHYQNMRKNIKGSLSQTEIDNLLHPNQVIGKLPKGIQSQTLELISKILQESNNPLSAEELANYTELSRVTIMRYIRYLISIGKVVEQLYYQEIGRPVNKYSFLL